MAPKTSRLIERRAGHDGQRRIEREMSDEHGEPAKHHAFQFRKAAHSSNPAWPAGSFDAAARCAARRHKQRQTLVEKSRGLLQTVGFHPSGGQFDRECHSVELSADADHDCGFRVTEVQASATCRRALDEQLWSPGTSGHKAQARRRKARRVNLELLTGDST